MNEIQSARWMDIAIEYLPVAQQFREEAKAWPTEDRESKDHRYVMGMWRIADKLMADGKMTTSVERCAANVLLGITGYELYDPNDVATAMLYKARNVNTDPDKMRNAMMQGIVNAVKTLANVTGRDISMVDPVVYFDTPAIPAAKVAQKRQRQDALAVELDQILAPMETQTPAKVMAKLREQIGKPNTCILRNVGDAIEWENDRGEVKNLTIDALGGRIREWKKTGLSQG